MLYFPDHNGGNHAFEAYRFYVTSCDFNTWCEKYTKTLLPHYSELPSESYFEETNTKNQIKQGFNAEQQNCRK